MRIKKTIALYGGYATAFLLILIGFAILQIKTFYHSENTSIYRLNNTEATAPDFSMDISISKEWIDETLHPEMPNGAQYDGVITNYTQEALRDWKLEIDLPQDSYIDSFWNGDYALENDKIIITPLDYNEQIPSNESISFGYVLYSKNFLDFQSGSLSGYQVIRQFSSPVFWGLVIAFLVWLIALIIQIITHLRTRKFLRRHAKDSKIISQSMNTFAGFIDAKDSYTQGHSKRVAIYSGEIARRMKLSPEEINTLYYIALMHDCGKIGIPDAILNKPDALTVAERNMIQSHTLLGGNVLKNFTAIPGIRDGALYHHERFDGQGYPSGLKGLQIPLYARIICIADSYDAMSSRRCYRKPFCKDRAIEELTANSGKQFDPDLVKYMIDMINDKFVNLVHMEIQTDFWDLEPTESTVAASSG